MYEARPVGVYGEWAVEFVDDTGRYRVATFGYISDPAFTPLIPHQRASDYAEFCNRQRTC